jgi:hypothetical protein
MAATWLGRVPHPYPIRFSQVRGYRRFLQGGSLLGWLNLGCHAYLAFFPPVVFRPRGRPGPAFLGLGLLNSSVTGTPKAVGTKARGRRLGGQHANRVGSPSTAGKQNRTVRRLMPRPLPCKGTGHLPHEE